MEFILAADKRVGIAKNGKLPWHIKEDMAYFKEITMGHTVVMGFNTWKSLDMKPLPGRNNIIISDVNEPIYGKDYIVSSLGLVYGLVDVELKDNKKVFIIGGDKTFMCFLDRIKSIYLTHIDKDYKCDTFATFFHNIHSNMNIVEHSKDYWSEKEQCNFRFLKYEKTNESHGEHQYLNLLKDILNNGHERDDRTGTGTMGVFGRQLRFDISKYIPLLTTKFVGYKTIVKELLWFLRGETDSKTLEKEGVNIWKGNSSEDFITKCNLPYREGDIGPMYGFQWMHFGSEYKGCDHDYTDQGINQLDEVIQLLTTDPYSRRIMMTTYNVSDRHKGVLYPCHGIVIQFFVENIKGIKHISCHMFQRSSDTFLGLSFNIASYATLVYIIALKVDMVPHELIISTGDTHIYKNHIEQCKLQLSRRPYPFPKLEINPEVKTKELKDITVDDFKLVGYLYHPIIKGDMSV